MTERAGISVVASAFARRDLAVATSYRVPFAFDVLLIALTFVTYKLIAQLVPSGRVPGGYFAFVMIGLAIAALVDGGVLDIANAVRQEQLQGTLEATLSAGLPVGTLAVAMSSYPVLAATVRGSIYAIVAVLLGPTLSAPNWPLAAVAAILGSISYVGIGLAGAGVVLVIKRGAAAVAWVVAALSLGAGQLFPPDLLPGWVRAFAQLSPFTIALRVAREAILEGRDWSSSLADLGILAGMAIVYVIGGVTVLAFALRRARHNGDLAQY